MNNETAPLLRLEGIKKVFFTDEVETHALSGIHLDIEKGDFVSIVSPVVSKPASRGRIKTGHSEVLYS